MLSRMRTRSSRPRGWEGIADKLDRIKGEGNDRGITALACRFA
jgi:hypothetical protein